MLELKKVSILMSVIAALAGCTVTAPNNGQKQQQGAWSNTLDVLFNGTKNISTTRQGGIVGASTAKPPLDLSQGREDNPYSQGKIGKIASGMVVNFRYEPPKLRRPKNDPYAQNEKYSGVIFGDVTFNHTCSMLNLVFEITETTGAKWTAANRIGDPLYRKNEKKLFSILVHYDENKFVKNVRLDSAWCGNAFFND